MSWKSFKNSLKSGLDGVAQLAGKAAIGWIRTMTGSGLTPAQEEQNLYNASEAENQRNWEAEMDSTRYQRQVADMKKAGVNPALLYGSGASPGSAPSGASATGSVSAAAGIGDFLAAIRFKKEQQLLQSQIENVQSDTGVNDSEAALNEAKAARERAETQLATLRSSYQQMYNAAFPDINDAELRRLASTAAELDAKANLELRQADFTEIQANIAKIDEKNKQALIDATIALMKAQKGSAEESAALSRAQAAWTSFQKTYAETYGSSLPNGAIVSVLSYLTERLDKENQHIAEVSERLMEYAAEQNRRSSGAGGRGSYRSSSRPAGSGRGAGLRVAGRGVTVTSKNGVTIYKRRYRTK